MDKASTVKNALGFVVGFTIVFTILGAFSAAMGVLLRSHQTVLQVITGAIVSFFGLHYLGMFQVPLFRGMAVEGMANKKMGFASSMLFGMVFSVGWTPCVGAFLGSALMMAAQQESAMHGVFMLLSYSLGLGLPFLISAIFISQLKSTFDFVKKRYDKITLFSGLLLVVVGVLMMTGVFGYWLAALSF